MAINIHLMAIVEQLSRDAINKMVFIKKKADIGRQL